MFASLNDMMAARRGEGLALTIVRGTDDRDTLMLGDLYDRALRRLTLLRRAGMGPGDHLILYVYDEALFLEVFWAALLGGIRPVPIAPGNTPDHKDKLLAVSTLLRDARIIIAPEALDRLQAHLSDTGPGAMPLGARLIPLVPLTGKEVAATPVQASRADVAFIQFSSGSTRTPRGVVLTHGNILDNLGDLAPAFGLDSDAVALSWMPLTHDMGIIGFHLCPVYAGADHVIMRTALFVRRPLAWLDLAAQTGATTLGSPNFGYRHWLKANRESGAALPDLRAVRRIINGAEPINRAVVQDFLTTLAPAGLSPDAMCPSFGLAEASLGVSVAAPGDSSPFVSVHADGLSFGQPVRLADPADPKALVFARTGTPLPRCRVRIATEDGQDLGADRLGEIQIAGSNVTAGYVAAGDENANLFCADGWLRTGDLGFLHDRQVVVTGRLKDMIVLAGRNYFAPDVEMLIEAQGLAAAGEVAAAALTGADGDDESFAVFVRDRQPSPEFARRAQAVREAVFNAMGLTLAVVVPVRSLPKTTSGKIQRAALARTYLAGDFDAALAKVAPPAPDLPVAEPAALVSTHAFVMDRIKALLEAEALDAAAIDARTSFFEMGVTSLMLATLTEDINSRYPDIVDVTDFFEHASVSEIAAQIDHRLQSHGTG